VPPITALRCRIKPYLNQGGACGAAGPALAPGLCVEDARPARAGPHPQSPGISLAHQLRRLVLLMRPSSRSTLSRSWAPRLDRPRRRRYAMASPAHTRHPLGEEMATAREGQGNPNRSSRLLTPCISGRCWLPPHSPERRLRNRGGRTTHRAEVHSPDAAAISARVRDRTGHNPLQRGLTEQEVLAAGTGVQPGPRRYGHATIAKQQAIGGAAENMYAQLRGT